MASILTPALALQGMTVRIAKTTLTTAPPTPVKMAAPVSMGLIPTPVNVRQALKATFVKPTLMIVPAIPARTGALVSMG